MVEVLAVVVTWNSAEVIEDCLNSLLRQRGVELRVVVVDNDSSDSTTHIVMSKYPGVLLVRNQNTGFGDGANKGAAVESSKYLLVLNPDIELPSSDVISNLAMVMEQRPEVGVAGCRTLTGRNFDKPDFIAYKRYPYTLSCLVDEVIRNLFLHRIGMRSFLSTLPPQHEGTVMHLKGACLLFDRGVYDEIGGYDPSYFLYLEDTDICKRISDYGRTAYHTAGTTIRHRGAHSGSQLKRATVLSDRSQTRFIHVHRGATRSGIYVMLLHAVIRPLRVFHWVVSSIALSVRREHT